MNRSTAGAFLIIAIAIFFGQTARADEVRRAVWIDTDPACYSRFTHDVDDCWALLLALRDDSLDIRGISSVFGNASEPRNHETLVRLLEAFAQGEAIPLVHRGATEPIGSLATSGSFGEPASKAMAAALTQEPLTIIALGPLTNIATLVSNYPQHIKNISSVIAVAGQRPQHTARIFPGESRLFHVHDFNFRKDVRAAEIVLNSPVSITLLPFEAARQIGIESSDLSALAQEGPRSKWLNDISIPWLRFWEIAFQADKFHPFDALAIGLVSWPQLFSCQEMTAWIEYKRALFIGSRDRLLVAHTSQPDSKRKQVNYCYGVNNSFKTELLASFR